MQGWMCVVCVVCALVRVDVDSGRMYVSVSSSVSAFVSVCLLCLFLCERVPGGGGSGVAEERKESARATARFWYEA